MHVTRGSGVPRQRSSQEPTNDGAEEIEGDPGEIDLAK